MTKCKNKRVLTLLLVSILVLALFSIANASVASEVYDHFPIQNDIGIEKAKTIALQNAGLSEGSVTFTKAKRDYDDGILEYDIEFILNGFKYDYELSAIDGKILSLNKEALSLSAFAPATNTDIGIEKAKSIALQNAGLSSSAVTFTKAARDYDDGLLEYEIEFVSNGIEYYYDISASNGTILSQSKETIGALSPPTNGDIGVEKAKSIALQGAGLTSAPVTFTKTERDYDDGILEYDIEFVYEGFEFEYEIRADSGAILSVSKELLFTTSALAPSTDDIGLEKAKSIALQNAGQTANAVTFTKAKLDYDDGILEYEIEFINNNWEYEYEINAANGSILSQEKEALTQSESTPPANGDIGLEKAKSIALKDAGLTANAVTFTDTELDYDDGILEYEIEFISNGMEYEYSIDARDGRILSAESEVDD